MKAGPTRPTELRLEKLATVVMWRFGWMFGPGAAADHVVVEPASHDDVAALLAVSEGMAVASLKIATGGEPAHPDQVQGRRRVERQGPCRRGE